MSKQIWVSPDWNNWKVKQPWKSKASLITNNKQTALNKAIQIAKNQWLELIAQRKDWKIHIKNSYWNDPRNIKG